MTLAIELTDVHKKFKVFYDKGNSLKEKILFRNRNHYEDRWVLQGISLKVEKGQAIGLIGENGCGKSTLLKLMSKIIYPDQGIIKMFGRVSSLIELGAGFHPDMSGRENIYTNAAIFGLTHKEIENRVNDIITFSELGDFIDNPVRTYSSGMYMRLAFAVAINVDADILLVDEILAVGDAAFQSKCFNKMREIKAAGTTIILVSHSLGQVEQICDYTYWINKGKIEKCGLPREVHPLYLDYMGNKAITTVDYSMSVENSSSEDVVEVGIRTGSGAIKICRVELISNNSVTNKIKTESDTIICIKYRCDDLSIKKPIIGIGIFRNDGLNIYGTNTQIEHISNYELKDEGEVLIKIDKLNILPGEYLLDVAFHKDDGFAYDYWRNCISFSVYSDLEDIGVARQKHIWDFQ